MAKRNDESMRTTASRSKAGASRSTTADAMEQRVVAFAERLGRVVGTVQGRAEGWMDRATLTKQISSVRDAAMELLDQLGGGATNAPNGSKAPPPAAAPRGGVKARSAGVVDAPGKKHRAPVPNDPGETIVHSQAAKLRATRTVVKTNQRRGRG